MTDLGALYAKYQARLERYAATIVGAEAAMDVVQQAFAELLVWLKSHPDRVIGIGELTQAVWFASKPYLRKLRRERRKQQLLQDELGQLEEQEEPEEEPQEEADSTTVDAENFLLLTKAFAAVPLPPQVRRCVDLVLLEGLTDKEAAEVLKITPSTVRTHLERGRKALRAALKDWRS